MNILIVTAHPASWGFTHKIAATYKEEKEQQGDTVDILDLYNPDNAQPFLCFEDIKKDCGPTVTKTRIQERVRWADELVFISPIWQMGMPAILKNFFDTNFEAGFAFKYTQQGLVQLLVGKRARFFFTADGPQWLYSLIYAPFFRYIQLGAFAHTYCGIRMVSVDVFGGMFHKRNDKARRDMLNHIQKRART